MDNSVSTNLVSVNCGLPRQILWRGQIVTTAIYKEPVRGRVFLRALNLDGDRQADLTVHGGASKAVYCYPVEHYEYWKTELPSRKFPYGSFGENFTVDGFWEDSVNIGDRFAVGSAEVVVTQPRLPCYKLGIRLESDQIVRKLLESGRTGFYLAVVREGEVEAGDKVIPLIHLLESVSVSVVTRLYVARRYERGDLEMIRRLLTVDALPESWKEHFRDKLYQFAK